MAALRLHLRLVVSHRHPIAVLSELPHNSCFASQFSLALSLSQIGSLLLSSSPTLSSCRLMILLYSHWFFIFKLLELGIASGRDRTQGGNAENIAQAVVIIEVEHEANLSDWQMSENTQVNLEETEIEYEVDSQCCSCKFFIYQKKRIKEKEGAKVRKCLT
ncbi:uncharacterized protein [Arachis hypogaea]|uniref:uncharacterized protein n=1 Tax=Arachis hypogaea TaxID=3818 RepID=UPI0034E64F08